MFYGLVNGAHHVCLGILGARSRYPRLGLVLVEDTSASISSSWGQIIAK